MPQKIVKSGITGVVINRPVNVKDRDSCFVKVYFDRSNFKVEMKTALAPEEMKIGSVIKFDLLMSLDLDIPIQAVNVKVRFNVFAISMDCRFHIIPKFLKH